MKWKVLNALQIGLWAVYHPGSVCHYRDQRWDLYRHLYCHSEPVQTDVSSLSAPGTIVFDCRPPPDSKFQPFVGKTPVSTVSLSQCKMMARYSAWRSIGCSLRRRRGHRFRFRHVGLRVLRLEHQQAVGDQSHASSLRVCVCVRTLSWCHSRWGIRLPKTCVTCFSPPSGCLQYLTGLTGRLTTFNFLDATGSSHLANQQYVNLTKNLIYPGKILCMFHSLDLSFTARSDAKATIS